MKTITRLTPAQIERFPEWVEKWTKIGLSTEPANFDLATDAALQVYQLVGKKPPRLILRLSSPLGAVLGGPLALLLLNKTQVRTQVEDQVGAQVWAQVMKKSINNLHIGSFWAGWGAYVSFFRDICSWTNPVLRKFEISEKLIISCGPIWWHQDVMIISDRPCLINLDERNRLHSETGPSIAYRDGWKLYHWHGTSVPEHWIEQRDKLDPIEVLKTDNIEQRAAGAAIVGWPKMVSRLNRKIIDGDPNTDIGALIELTLPGINEPGRFLQAICPRNGIIVEGVPRISDIDNKPIETAIAAQAWRDGLPASEYQHPLYRT